MKTLIAIMVTVLVAPQAFGAERHKPSDVRVKAETFRIAVENLGRIGSSAKFDSPELKTQWDKELASLTEAVNKGMEVPEILARLNSVNGMVRRLGLHDEASAKATEAAVAEGRGNLGMSETLGFKSLVDGTSKSQLAKDIASLPKHVRDSVLAMINERIMSKNYDAGWARAQQNAILNAIRVYRSKEIDAPMKEMAMNAMAVNFKHGVDEPRTRSIEEMAMAKDVHTLKVTSGFETIHDKVYQELLGTKTKAEDKMAARQEAAELVAKWMAGEDNAVVQKYIDEVFTKNGIDIKRDQGTYCQMVIAGCIKATAAQVNACKRAA